LADASASGYISSLVNILELLEKYQFGIVVDNVDNRVSKKDFSMEEINVCVNLTISADIEII
jgi:hypothetical protein